MSSQFIFSAVAAEAVHVYSKLPASVIFNKAMVEHYQQLTTRHRQSGNIVKQFFCWRRLKMYQRKLADAELTEFLNDLNKHHHGPAITANSFSN
jgi:hypothetical protein